MSKPTQHPRTATFTPTPHHHILVHVKAPDIGYPREAIIAPSNLSRYITAALARGFDVIDHVTIDHTS